MARIWPPVSQAHSSPLGAVVVFLRSCAGSGSRVQLTSFLHRGCSQRLHQTRIEGLCYCRLRMRRRPRNLPVPSSRPRQSRGSGEISCPVISGSVEGQLCTSDRFCKGPKPVSNHSKWKPRCSAGTRARGFEDPMKCVPVGLGPAGPVG